MATSPLPVLPGTRLAAGAARLAARHADVEAGVDPADAFPRPLTDEVVQAADAVVTMGCGDACPVVPGRRCPEWPVADPEGAPIAAVHRVRDQLDAHPTDLLRTLPGA